MERQRPDLFNKDNSINIENCSIADAIAWANAKLTTLESQHIEVIKLKEEQPDAFAFMEGMKKLRTSIMISRDQVDTYTNAFLFANRVIQSDTDAKRKLFIPIDDEPFTGYFNDLIDIENNHFEVDAIKMDNGIPENFDLQPSTLAMIFERGKSNSHYLAKVGKTFIDNSESETAYMLDAETGLRTILSNRNFINTFGYGYLEGLKYGMADFYGGIRKSRDASNISNVLRTKVRGISLKDQEE